MNTGNRRMAGVGQASRGHGWDRQHSTPTVTNTALQTSDSKILGVGIRMELYAAQGGGRTLYFEFRRDVNCKRLFFWNRLREVLVQRGFDIKGGFSDEEWAVFPFNRSVVAGSVLASSKTYGAEELDLIKTDVQAMFDLWTDADIKDIASVGQAGAESNADMLDVAMMSVA